MRSLVVGGTGGIGRAIVRRYVAAGVGVTFTYFTDRRAAAELEQQCAATGGDVSSLQLDVRDPRAIEEVVDRAGEDLRDVIFAATSSVLRQPSEATAKHWTWTFEANERAFGLLYRAAFGRLRQTGGGTVIALTSVGSRVVLPGYALQGATKAAIEAIVRYAAVEAAPHNVRVNAVSPGIVKTKALEPFAHGRKLDSGLEEVRDLTPMGRLITGEEVAELVWFLASPAASMITGQCLVIDGGWELPGRMPTF